MLNALPALPFRCHTWLLVASTCLMLPILGISSASADDEKKPIPKVGSCPVGYRTSGGYCIPLDNTNKEVVIKLKSCPPGYRTSGNYCIKLK